MLVGISKNDRAQLLFAELKKLDPSFVDLGSLRASRLAKMRAAVGAITSTIGQWRTDIDFSPVVAEDLQEQTKTQIQEYTATSHILQWGAMYAPMGHNRTLPYSIITDGPYDPNDPAYPVEWRPARWGKEYFERQRSVYSAAAFVFTLSEWARKKVIDVHSLDPTRVVRIGWGPMFTVGEPNLSPSRPTYFLSIGNQWHRKGMDLVAEAGHMIHLQYSHVNTIIAGEPQGLKIPGRVGVSFIPRKLVGAEVKELLAGARALLVVSRFDASPHIIMEALQLGTPVIGSDVCGIPEAINAPAGGKVIAREDLGAFVAAMASVLDENVFEQRRNASAVFEGSGGWKRSAQIILATLGNRAVNR
jgi:glycosyltransferase involved in cell wall biosynthesis